MDDQGKRRVCSDRGKTCADTTKVLMMKPTFTKVEVVYYLSRSNGLLEHPHYIEVTHLANQQLRLKDVLDRLTVLRGKGMPSLYSWSCKRSYKNGYVWHDLGQNDVVPPAGGGEYVLKGSELPLGFTEKLHHLQLGNVEVGVPDTNIQPKRRFIASKRQINLQETIHNQYDHHPVEEEEEQDYDVKPMPTRCSRGVSTEEPEAEFKHKHSPQPTHTRCSTDVPTEEIQQTLCPNTSSSTTTSSTLSDTNPNDHKDNITDPVGSEPMLSRNSMLLNLIACGGTGSFRKNVLPPLPPRKSSVAKVGAGEEQESEMMMIKYMSENPRFGNLQSEEKEYFSGSIVEAITNDERVLDAHPAVLKKSASYNQQRSSKAGITEVAKEVEEEKGVRGKCIPRTKKKKSTSKLSNIEH